MIRVFLYSEETISESLKDFLEKSDEIILKNDPVMSDVILLCISIWNRRTLERIRHILNRTSKPAVVICERAEDPFATASIARNEVSGVLLYNASGEQILLSLRAAAAGLKVLQTFESKRLSSETITLTPRELEILRLIADGEGNKSIAYLLEISEHTVKFHISSILEKLHVSSRTEAIKAGILRGFISI